MNVLFKGVPKGFPKDTAVMRLVQRFRKIGLGLLFYLAMLFALQQVWLTLVK